jgi:phosphoribosyl-dephospho-CoA transferase
MELNPHDLIRIDSPKDVLTDLPFPDWAAEALRNAPYVVVRRATSPAGLIPVGIRGRKRGQRLAAWLNPVAVQEVITPQMLASDELWNVERNEFNNSLRSLQNIAPVLNQEGLCWGPTGSTGFQLATSVETLTANSDLDLTIRLDRKLTVSDATLLLAKLNAEALIRLDVQLEIPMGCFSLAEYVNSSTVLVKTASGPLLVERVDLWNGARFILAPSLNLK